MIAYKLDGDVRIVKKAIWLSCILSILANNKLAIYQILDAAQQDCRARKQKCITYQTLSDYLLEMERKGLLESERVRQRGNLTRKYYWKVKV